ncbi:hypothetical protein FH972_025142 [Carpinus fangiana]|uniref:Saccharopine dehydrogenase [NAD(+), L-lysine-forming] n=1 Tax=Carpinus fangiana TaxID=176857 RepID=A0A5N6L2Q1_9ROSI|nr:hypothetical protein FH972_025142 [Carpinus fangiana]
MAPSTLHLRSETKPLEHRSALTPSTAKALLDAGYTVNIERSPVRIFDDAEFENVGATLVPEGSWPDAPADHIIIGLKELPETDTFPLKHTHVQFAHCYKGQAGWDTVLGRFPRGGGTLLDLEFLEENGRRVAAFGYHAGFAGAALAVETWAHQLEQGDKSELKDVKPYKNEEELLAHVREAVEKGAKIAGKKPRALVIGALGRCGRGAVDLFQKVGVPDENVLKWDLAETSAKPGPYPEIIESDIFVNCIYLSKPIPPFIDQASLDGSAKRQLSVVCDVSCDTTNPHNPIPIYTVNTTFTKPTVRVPLQTEPILSVISIDHLPTLMPREASEAFSNDLLPHLLALKERDSKPVWQGAEKLFKDKVATLPSS